MLNSCDSHDVLNKYKLHAAVFENNLILLNNLLKISDINSINALDVHGRSPLMLATVLGHIECAELLLKNGANANTQSKEMWLLSHEAISLGNPNFLKKVLNYRDYQRAFQTLKILLELRNSLKGTDDFYVEMSWEFTSWLRFVKNMCPSDTYKIYKSDKQIRIDTTLIDFDSSYRCKRGNQSFIFRFTDNDKAEIVFINHSLKLAHLQTIDLVTEPKLEDFEPSEDIVTEKLLSSISTSYVNVENVGFERSKSSSLFSWIGLSDKEEEVEGFTCRMFNATNVEIITKTRMDHLKEEDKKKYLESENKPMSFLLSLFEKKKSNNSAESLVDSGDPDDVYGGLTTLGYLNESNSDQQIRIGRPIKEAFRCNSFNASLWLADSFPLNLQVQIFPIIDLMAVRNAKFLRLKNFIQLQLPAGFPIRISIPLFHMINAQITFKNVNEPAPGERKVEGVEIDDLGLPVFRLHSSLFDIPKGYTINRSGVSVLFGNIGHAEIDRDNNIDVDDDYIYLLERFMNEDLSETPETSSYRQQMQLAIEQSIIMSNEQNHINGSSNNEIFSNDIDNIANDELLDFELAEAIRISKIEEEQRKREIDLEEEELRKVLELSKSDLYAK